MRKIREVLRLKLEAKLSHQQTANALGVSKGLVAKYVGLAAAAHLDWPTILELDEVTLIGRLLAVPDKPAVFVMPDYADVHQALRRKGVTLMLLWEEYRLRHADQTTYGYSQFCEHYRRFARTLKRSMRQTHRAGEKLFIDFAGPTLPLSNGQRAHIFVAALGASSYTFACATPQETTADWLHATAQALQFFGGVPLMIVPDNPKAMITVADRYEPQAHDTALDFARHYKTSILPARPRHPQDKARVESAVQVVERWIMARLRHQVFHRIDELNLAIMPLLTQLNDKPFQKLPGSRASAFVALDAPALAPLPLIPYELATFKTVKVHIDYHIEVDRHRYSVPHALVGQTLEARITRRTIELLHRGQRIASHPRHTQPGGFTTQEAHMPKAHRAHRQWTPQRLIHWGQSIGTATAALISRLLAEHRHPEHGYRASLGLLSLAKRYGNPRLEQACQLAISLGAYRYRIVANILRTGRDQQPIVPVNDWISPEHAHVRGSSYYQ